MGKKQYRENYTPFAGAELIESSEFIEKILKPAGNYDKLDVGQRAFLLAASKIIKTGESLAGRPFFSLRGGESDQVPSNWSPIINYLKAKKLANDFIFGQVYCDEPKIIRSFIISNHEELVASTDGRRPSSIIYAHGESLDSVDEAMAKAVGEFLERSFFLLYRENDFLRCSSDDLRKRRKKYLKLDELAGFSSEQKEKRIGLKFDGSSNFLWTKGRSLFDSEDIFIPAQLIFWNYNIFHKGWNESFIKEPNTNGAGGHCTLEEAILSGLYELIQRDGFLIYWLNKKAPPRIDLQTIEYEPLNKLLDECRRLNLDVGFYDTTSDLDIPSCFCAVFDHTGVGPKISVGGGCEADWKKALYRSLLESLSIHHWSRERKEMGTKIIELGLDYKPFEDQNIRQLERLDLWAQENMFDHFLFFTEGEKESFKKIQNKSLNFYSAKEELDYLAKKFKSLGRGYEIFYCQAENKILEEINYFAVKVIVPRLVPLYLRETSAPLGSLRLKEVPEKLGFKPAKQWNPLPHPFP